MEQAITYDGEKWNRMDPTFTANSEDERALSIPISVTAQIIRCSLPDSTTKNASQVHGFFQDLPDVFSERTLYDYQIKQSGAVPILVNSFPSYYVPEVAIEGLAILNDDSQTERGKEILTFLIKTWRNPALWRTPWNSPVPPASAAAYVRTGEETGCLDEVMKGLSAFYAKEIQITDQIQSAVAYPLVMLGMMTAVIVILLVKVLPVFRQVFRQLGLEMSGISGALLGIGETLSHYSTAFLVLLAAMIGFILFLVLHPKGQELIRKSSAVFQA